MSNMKMEKVWKLRNIFYVSATMTAFLLVAAYALKNGGVLDYFERYKLPGLTVLVFMLLQWLAMLGPLYFLVLRKLKNPRELLGFNANLSWLKCLKYAVFAYLAYFLLNFLITVLFLNFGIDLPGYQAQEPHLPIFGRSIFGLISAILTMVIIAPIVEEIFFRGFILNTIVEKAGRIWGNIIAAAIFAGFHLEFQSFWALMLLGLIMNELFLRTRSIKATIIFHTINNTLALLLEYYLQT